MKYISPLLIFLILCNSCKNDPTPKPKAFLSLEYPEANYELIALDCPFYFEKNEIAEVSPSKNNLPCWFTLNYDQMNGSIFITYQEVTNNLDSLLMDAQKLPRQHVVKADAIAEQPYFDVENKVYGMFYEVDGDAASQAQFYLTDSTNHFLTGSVYFNIRPNFDSIVPAASYLKDDIRYLMESLRWQEN